ncbi:MAG: S8 family peptidase [Bacteroidia bacterium]|nr:S8 family peptidase [Bacteroidia bacterium]
MNKRLLFLAALLSVTPFFLHAGTTGNGPAYRIPSGVSPSDYMDRCIVFKVKPEYRSLCAENNISATPFQKITANLGAVQLFRMFPRHQAPTTEYNERGQKLVDLSLIYELHFSANADLVKTINSFLGTGLFMYAEPKFIPRTQYTPNDPQTGLQYFLSKINAYDAWDIHKGDTNTVIGITDTGTDLDHPDLESNIKYNYSDPVNGVDDDADGFTDNFQGWDIGENDNWPQVNASAHGSHVSGCAAAVTDNNTGVASPGFYCKFLPVKISDASGALTKAYEGIVYAADAGCQIINCSWGGAGGSSLGQNIVDYATFNKNSLVIAAAGNNSTNTFFYPAAYNNILCIASTSSSDAKSSFSNFGSYVDVCAPGSGIFSAQHDNTYALQSGTSMASPVAAGCAAIIKSYFPSYNALQVGEQLRVTADNIYNLPSNASYQNQLGTGRINLLNALTLSGPSIRMNNRVVTDNNDNILVVNDTMRIVGDFVNYLSPTLNLVVTLTSTSPYVTILDGSTTIGALATLATSTNTADPFTVKINANAPQNTPIAFKLTFQDGTYNDFQLFTETVNVDYLNITINDVFTTNTSKGRLCYNAESQAEGLGFNYNSDGTLTYEAGFMAGIAGNVADNVRGATVTDDDFLPVVTIQKNDPGIWSDFDTYGRFSDASNPSPMNLLVDHRSLSWTLAPFSKFHIFEYTLRNNGTGTLNNLYAGVFSDWDIQTYANNKADQDAALKLGYAFCTDPGGYYAGIKVLTATPFIHYAIDNINGGAGGINMFDGFDSNEKYQALSTNRPTSGGAGTGNDVIDVVGTGPFTLAPGDSAVVAFALIAGDELSDLQSGAQQAQIKYDLATALQENSPSGIYTANAYPNPASGTVLIPVYLQQSGQLVLEIYDSMGKLISVAPLGLRQAGEQEIRMDLSTLAGGLYHYRLSNEKGAVGGTIQKQ